jgi:hypothetical protein
LHDRNCGQVTILLREVQTITDYEFVGNFEADVGCLDVLDTPGRFAQESTDVE